MTYGIWSHSLFLQVENWKSSKGNIENVHWLQKDEIYFWSLSKRVKEEREVLIMIKKQSLHFCLRASAKPAITHAWVSILLKKLGPIPSLDIKGQLIWHIEQRISRLIFFHWLLRSHECKGKFDQRSNLVEYKALTIKLWCCYGPGEYFYLCNFFNLASGWDKFYLYFPVSLSTFNTRFGTH